jgi:hypothetical protein
LESRKQKAEIWKMKRNAEAGRALRVGKAEIERAES